MKALPEIQGEPERYTWDFRRKDLREQFLKDPNLDFMSWGVTYDCLYTEDTPDVQAEIKELEKEGRWELLRRYGTYVHQLYSLHLWEKHTSRRISDLSRIAEVGGGYGELARVCREVGFTGSYITFDFPEFLILQMYYLEKHLGNEYENDTVFCDNLQEFTNEAKGGDLLIGICSMSEMEPSFRKEIIDSVMPSSLLVRYQQTFYGRNNVAFFAEEEKAWPNVNNPIICHHPNHKYFIGWW